MINARKVIGYLTQKARGKSITKAINLFRAALNHHGELARARTQHPFLLLVLL
jgi:hypothetical protein